MIRGTTPTHVFRFPFDTGLLKDLRITYAQNGETVVERSLTDCDLNGNELSFILTQEETLRFSDDVRVERQIRALKTNGKVFATDVEYMSVARVLNEEVLT